MGYKAAKLLAINARKCPLSTPRKAVASHSVIGSGTYDFRNRRLITGEVTVMAITSDKGAAIGRKTKNKALTLGVEHEHAVHSAAMSRPEIQKEAG